ncbi:hypothetical protein [Streptomyces sp. NBC_01294]|uniref:hypothetical protein n=1 Tax=Streptomyces sp. NBC_01294 TaxID=2903815 RepID=UPI002DD7D2F1|nr:hypothetical protein [Streptomyces sp. NBC_01294]WRZ59397.1 hypothetical protein OG534_24675 [Streptomyces sp. NBC_01294]
MENKKPQAAYGGDGCLGGVVRGAVKIVALLVVLPVRVVWDLVVAFGRGLYRYVLGPLVVHVVEPVLRALWRLVATLFEWLFVRPWVALWRYVLRPLGSWLYRYLLGPAGRVLYAYLLRPLGLAFARLVRLTWCYLLVPVGRGLVWLALAVHRYLLLPLHRYVLVPLGRALAWAWYVAGLITGGLWWGCKWVGRVLVGWPAALVYRYVLTPAGHLVRAVWRPVRDTVREVRAEVRRALFGTPPVEPARSRARTLGSTTAAGNTPAPEISLRERQG